MDKPAINEPTTSTRTGCRTKRGLSCINKPALGMGVLPETQMLPCLYGMSRGKMLLSLSLCTPQRRHVAQLSR